MSENELSPLPPGEGAPKGRVRASQSENDFLPESPSPGAVAPPSPGGRGKSNAAVGTPTDDPWTALRRHTAARIALGRSGSSLPTREVLAFGLAHAQARDAVHLPLGVASLRAQLEADSWPVIEVSSRAGDRAAYLARPDWGRRLLAESAATLDTIERGLDLVFVVSDGLSSFAVQRNAAPLLLLLKAQLQELRVAPVVIATQARVALADEVGERIGARVAVSLIGERPGLSSPDSLGAYITFGPKIGNTDEARNCISNIRPEGFVPGEAALLIAANIRAALHAQLSGVALRFDPSRVLSAG